MKTHILYFWIATLGGMLFGYDTAVINGAMPFFTSYFNLSDAMVGWSVSSGLVGCILGASFASWPADRLGRRDSMKIAALLFLVSALGTGFAYNFTMFIIARILGGIAVGAVSVIMPIYLSEITPAKHRGSSTINFQLGVVVGILAAFFVDYLLIDTGEYNWRYMFLSMALPSLFFFTFLLQAKRSPRWLIQQGHISEANIALQEYNSPENSIKSIREIQASLHKQDNKQDCPSLFKKTLFAIHANRHCSRYFQSTIRNCNRHVLCDRHIQGGRILYQRCHRANCYYRDNQPGFHFIGKVIDR